MTFFILDTLKPNFTKNISRFSLLYRSLNSSMTLVFDRLRNIILNDFNFNMFNHSNDALKMIIVQLWTGNWWDYSHQGSLIDHIYINLTCWSLLQKYNLKISLFATSAFLNMMLSSLRHHVDNICKYLKLKKFIPVHMYFIINFENVFYTDVSTIVSLFICFLLLGKSSVCLNQHQAQGHSYKKLIIWEPMTIPFRDMFICLKVMVSTIKLMAILRKKLIKILDWSFTI